MAIRQVRIWPDPALREVAKPVGKVDDEIRALVQDLFDTMYEENGIGLAATQIADPRRVLVIDLDPHGDADEDAELAAELKAMGFPGPRAYINPEIIAAEGEISFEEGCLSVPGINEPVKRKARVVVEALDERGERTRVEANGLFAVCLQHERDHLEGKVFVEYLSKLKRDVIRRKMETLKREQQTEASESVARA